jgi:hypothetical protein
MKAGCRARNGKDRSIVIIPSILTKTPGNESTRMIRPLPLKVIFGEGNCRMIQILKIFKHKGESYPTTATAFSESMT